MASVVRKIAGTDPRTNVVGQAHPDMHSVVYRGYPGIDTDFSMRLTSLPFELQDLNATYTRNSVKNVVQNGALVALSANQFGTSYDDVAAQYGYVPEPAATNLATNSDGNAATYTVSNTADGTAVPGFTNGIAFGDNSVQRSATKAISVTSGTTYSISFFIIMDDGNAPVVGTTNILGDFSITCNAVIATTKLERVIGSSVYRVSASIAAAATSSQPLGCIKYTGQSARTFRITGIQVETGLRATSYIATAGSTASRSADVLTVPLWVNNVKDSQDFSTANWSRTNCTVTTSGTAPDGSATAQLITVTTTASAQVNSALFKAPASTVTVSQYVKQGNKPTALLVLRNATTSTNFTVGTLTFATGVVTGTGWAATDVGNGWFRCTYTNQPGDVISVGDSLAVYPLSSASRTAGDTQYAWGFQLEPGSVATAYRRTVNNLEYARNMASFSDGNAATYTVSNVSDGTAVPSFTNGLAFGINSVDRTASKTITLVVGVTYTVSIYVIMDDLGVPVAGGSYASGDFRMLIDGYGTTAGTAVHVGNNVYRVSATFTCITGGARACGLGKYTGQSARTFRASGIQVEVGSTLTDYEPTNTITPSANANIVGYNSAGYTLSSDYRNDVATSGTLLRVSQDASNFTRTYTTSSGNVEGLSYVAASVTGAASSTSGLTRNKFAMSFAASNFKAAKNGSTVASTSGALPPTPTTLNFDQLGTTGQLNGFIYRAQLIPIALTQAQLNGLTT